MRVIKKKKKRGGICIELKKSDRNVTHPDRAQNDKTMGPKDVVYNLRVE